MRQHVALGFLVTVACVEGVKRDGEIAEGDGHGGIWDRVDKWFGGDDSEGV